MLDWLKKAWNKAWNEVKEIFSKLRTQSTTVTTPPRKPSVWTQGIRDGMEANAQGLQTAQQQVTKAEHIQSEIERQLLKTTSPTEHLAAIAGSEHHKAQDARLIQEAENTTKARIKGLDHEIKTKYAKVRQRLKEAYNKIPKHLSKAEKQELYKRLVREEETKDPSFRQQHLLMAQDQKTKRQLENQLKNLKTLQKTPNISTIDPPSSTPPVKGKVAGKVHGK